MASTRILTGWAIALTHRGSVMLVTGFGLDLAMVKAYATAEPKGQSISALPAA
jgi:hypothetical protein